MQTEVILETAAAAIVFAAVFLFGGRIPLFRNEHRRHLITSFAAGMSAAYVFVHVMPQLTELRHLVVEASSGPLPFQGGIVYFVAMIGFLAFYGLDELRVRLGRRSERTRAPFRIHIAGFAVYVWLVAYLLVRGLEESIRDKGLYAGALALHFLTMDGTLRDEHRSHYDKSGRYVLAAMAIGGWLTGFAVDLHGSVVALLMAFICGGVIVNTAIAELPLEKEGVFVPFVSGGVLYGAFLLTLA